MISYLLNSNSMVLLIWVFVIYIYIYLFMCIICSELICIMKSDRRLINHTVVLWLLMINYVLHAPAADISVCDHITLWYHMISPSPWTDWIWEATHPLLHGRQQSCWWWHFSQSVCYTQTQYRTSRFEQPVPVRSEVGLQSLALPSWHSGGRPWRSLGYPANHEQWRNPDLRIPGTLIRLVDRILLCGSVRTTAQWEPSHVPDQGPGVPCSVEQNASSDHSIPGEPSQPVSQRKWDILCRTSQNGTRSFSSPGVVIVMWCGVTWSCNTDVSCGLFDIVVVFVLQLFALG